MIPELAEPSLLNARQSLGMVFAVSAVLIVPWGQALLRWRRHGDAVTAGSSLSYRGWSIAFVIALVILHLTCFGSYWLRLSFGKVFTAEVQRTTQTRFRGRTYHKLFATSTNPQRWSLQSEVSTALAGAVDAQLPGQSGSAPSVQVPFLVVPFWPAIHQLGTRATLEPVLGSVALIGALLFLLGYGTGAPELSPSYGRFMRVFLDGLAGFMGALFDQLLELPAMIAVAFFVSPRIRGAPLSGFDVLPVLVLGACLWVLLKRIVCPGPRVLEVHRFGTTRLAVPSISLYHFLFDAAWLALGAVFLQPPRSDVALGMGLGFTIVPALLVMARLLGWRSRHRID